MSSPGRHSFSFFEVLANSYQIAAAHIPKGLLSTRVFHELQSIEYLAPALPLIVVIAFVSAIYRRNALVLAVGAVLGAGAGFTLITYLMNTTFPWFRFYILWIPIAILLVATLFAEPIRLSSTKYETEQRVGVSKVGVSERQTPRWRAMGAIAAWITRVLSCWHRLFQPP